jgi:ParB family chromosome partitioning protein
MQQDKKLGRGLSALLGDSKTQRSELLSLGNTNHESFVELIEIEKVVAGHYQPRREFNQKELDELADSIKQNGLIQPIIVRKADNFDRYEVIAGERRLRASKIAGLTKISAIIRKINNHEALELALIENIQRSDLSLIEEAEGYKQLMTEFRYTQEEVAHKIGKSRSHIANMLRLLVLPLDVRRLLEQKQLSMGHARAIINSNNPEKLAKKIVAADLNVRDAENLARDEKIQKIKHRDISAQAKSKEKFVSNQQLLRLESELSDIFDNKVTIFYNQIKKSGKITINFTKLAKIHKIVEKINS